MADPAQWASLVLLAGLAIEKLMARCNMYDQVKTMHCAASRCCEFDMRRNTPPCSPASTFTPSLQMSGAATPPHQPQPGPNSLQDLMGLAEAVRKLSVDQGPTVQKMSQ